MNAVKRTLPYYRYYRVNFVSPNYYLLNNVNHIIRISIPKLRSAPLNGGIHDSCYIHQNCFAQWLHGGDLVWAKLHLKQQRVNIFFDYTLLIVVQLFILGFDTSWKEAASSDSACFTPVPSAMEDVQVWDIQSVLETNVWDWPNIWQTLTQQSKHSKKCFTRQAVVTIQQILLLL